jgi:hypothetical protein
MWILVMNPKQEEEGSGLVLVRFTKVKKKLQVFQNTRNLA